MKQIIIGLGAKARQGKDTAAAAILNYYDDKLKTQLKHGLKPASPRVFRVGFADALYELARTEYGMKEKDAPLLQRLGQEGREKYGADYWVKKAFEQIKTSHDIVVIPDVRYTNEADYIKSRGGYLVKVSRLNKDGSLYIDPNRPANHPSETELDNYRGWDLQFTVTDGDQALTGQLAISYVEYLRAIHG